MDVILSRQGAIEQECDVLVSGIFQDERPLKLTSGWLDWRFNGRLSRLVTDKKLTGDWNETTLIPSGGRITPKMVLLCGLGKSKEYGILRLRDLFPHLLKTLKNLQASSVCLSLPYEEGKHIVDVGKQTEIFLESTADCLNVWKHTAAEEWIKALHLFLAEGENLVSEILLGIQAARTILRNRLPIRVLVASKENRGPSGA